MVGRPTQEIVTIDSINGVDDQHGILMSLQLLFITFGLLDFLLLFFDLWRACVLSFLVPQHF